MSEIVDQIYLSSPDVGILEEEYVLSALRSGWIAPLGPDVDAFEREVADRVGVAHAVALSSGTAALHLALEAWGIGRGDVVVTSSMTFAATAFAVRYTGAEPYFVDCDLETGNISVDLLEQVLHDVERRGERVAAILPVDLFGKPVDYDAIGQLARRYGARLLADAAESLGSSYRGQPTGSFGDASAFSFNGNKVMTTSGGGMLTTNDEELAGRVRYLSTQARQPTRHYEHVEVGFNYRLSNILAALGRAQLARLDGMIERRRQIRASYRAYFADVDGVEVFGIDGSEAENAWLTSIVIDADRTGWRPDELADWLAADAIESRPVWKPMHLQPVFRDARAALNGNSERLFATALTLPSGSVLDKRRLDRVLGSVDRFRSQRD